ncbi:hypothetical protein [Pseudoalteromonas rubra]|uniref:Uncharacterized protein n=1 Tax=Pseudoalteromonas rubra TaxID=43658 RepID=A0A0U3I4P6_9GAMM|nr:hypothetical protein [Pseudoalteromonas rubra]ALU42023.1 hypothetical protein AT705_03180 [Pseudoalteromonas rubra]
MVKSGVFSPEPQGRFDYLNFHFPEKETRVLEYQPVYFNYEYADKYIGRCINPGAAVVLRLPSNEDDAYLQSVTTAISQEAITFICQGKYKG